MEQMPDMDHFRPHLQRHRHVRRARHAGQPYRVVQQCFRRADLDIQRRDAFQVGVNRRRQRRPRIGAVEVMRRHFQKRVFLHDRVLGGFSGHGAADAFHVDPGRDTPAARRLRQARVPDRQQRRHYQAASGAISGDRDVVRRDALSQQITITGERVFDRGRKRVLGRQTVMQRQRSRAQIAGDLRRHMAVAVERADDVAATVQIQHRADGVGALRAGPFGRHAVGGDRFDHDVARGRKYLGEGIEPQPAFRDIRRTRAKRQQFA